jgi:hypothetical protein
MLLRRLQHSDLAPEIVDTGFTLMDRQTTRGPA